MNPIDEFNSERDEICSFFSTDRSTKQLTSTWMNHAQSNKYSYQFDWLSRPIIQYPQDIVAMQELIWSIKPDLIIETGIEYVYVRTFTI